MKQKILIVIKREVAAAMVMTTVVVVVALSTTQNSNIVLAASRPRTSQKACSRRATSGWARCHALIATDEQNLPLATTAPQGFGPASFRQAYKTSAGQATTVAVVVAYDAPRIANDLKTFSQTFGLPVLTECSSAKTLGCFKKVNQRGGSSYPKPDSGWAVEASMDVESVHGMCPNCSIILVEADSPTLENLSIAVNEAAREGAKIISNSYGGPETADQTKYDSSYRHPGVAIVASSGDSGYGTSYPAASPEVVAVGGTSLRIQGSNITETAWNGAGSGCSSYEPKPAWQRDKNCKRRSLADVAADADPATGAAIYDSYPTNGRSGWFKVGGTSLAAPLVAGAIASSGKIAGQPAWFYGNPAATRDITAGQNGNCPSYLCKSGIGYDGPTGLGSIRL